MTCRGLAVALCLTLLTAGGVRAEDLEKPVPTHRARPAASARPAAAAASTQTDSLLHQLADAQRALGDQMQQLRERVDALHGELAKGEDQDSDLEQEVKGLRDEVKGLYVDNSTVKQQIDALKEDVGGVNSNVIAFRTFSGFFIAVMILLLAVIFVMTIRR
jgi:chromosome segregation ATPase